MRAGSCLGCGAALSRKPGDRMLNAAFDRGVNVYDVGTSKYYGAAERHLSAFAREKRDEIFLISKASSKRVGTKCLIWNALATSPRSG